MPKIILTITGPSGSGKTSIVRTLQKQYGIQRVVTCTTRECRQGETDGVDYHFIKPSEFACGNFIAPVKFAGNYYGISIEKMMEQFVDNDVLVVVVEPSGAQKLKEELESPGLLVRRVYIEIDKKKALSYMARRYGWKEAKRRQKDDIQANMYCTQYELCEKYDCVVTNGRSCTVKSMAYNVMNYLEAVKQEESLEEGATK